MERKERNAPSAAPVAARAARGSATIAACVPAPRAAPAREELPHALTFFLTSDERRRVLACLRREHRERTAALLRALGVEQTVVRRAGQAER